jgi:hypothetical protein
MTDPIQLPEPVRQGDLWVLPSGRTFPVIRGGSGEVDPPTGIVVTPPAGTPPPDRTFTSDEVEAIRKEEKDKLYTQLKSQKEAAEEAKSRADELDAQMAAFTTDAEAAKAVKADEVAVAAAERKSAEEAQLEAKDLLAVKELEWSQRMEESENKWATQFAEVNERAAKQEATLEKERAFQVLESYKAQAISDAGDTLMPHLIDLIGGSTEEDINNSILAVAAKTSAIMEDMQLGQGYNPGPRAVPTTGASPTGPLENQTAQQTLTRDDIATMSMDQYAALRPQLLAQARPRG